MLPRVALAHPDCATLSPSKPASQRTRRLPALHRHYCTAKLPPTGTLPERAATLIPRRAVGAMVFSPPGATSTAAAATTAPHHRSIKPRVALCLAGAFRQFEDVWPSMLEHLVAPTNAAVFVATSMPGAGNKGSGSRKSYHAQKLGLQVLREHIGSSLRGGATWSEGSAMSADGIAKWAGLH